MSVRKFLVASSLSASLLFASTAIAQVVTVGATVTDPQGGQVGTITAVEGDTVLLRTDRHEVRLPVASFTAAEDKVLFAVTRDQLNADIDRIQAQAREAFVVGSSIHGRDGAVVGTITALDEQTVTVQVGEGVIRLPRASVVPGQNGLVVGATRAELQAAAVPAPAGGSGR